MIYHLDWFLCMCVKLYVNVCVDVVCFGDLMIWCVSWFFFLLLVCYCSFHFFFKFLFQIHLLQYKRIILVVFWLLTFLFIFSHKFMINNYFLHLSIKYSQCVFLVFHFIFFSRLIYLCSYCFHCLYFGCIILLLHIGVLE